MIRAMYEKRKAFAKELSERLTAEEIAMILYSYECEVCAEQEQGTVCSFKCAEGICEKAIKDFSEHYNFKEHKEIERGDRAE